MTVVAGLQTLNYVVPTTMTLGSTYARVRLSTAGGLEPNGLADDGEVEDYVITIREDVTYSLPATSTDVTVRQNGSNVELIDNGGGGAVLFSKPVLTTQSLRIAGTSSPDTFNVDFTSGGYFAFPDGIVIDGGGDSDSVVVQGTGTSTASLGSSDGTLAGATVEVTHDGLVTAVQLSSVGPVSVLAMQSIQIQGDLDLGAETLSLAATDPIVRGTMIEMAGGKINSAGPISVGGALKYRAPDGVTPVVGDSFMLMSGSAITGTFTSVDFPTPPLGSDWDLSVGPTELRLTLVDLGQVGPLAIGDGSASPQHSRITKIDVAFDGLVDIDPGAFEVRKRDPEGGVVATSFVVNTDPQGNSVATLTFSGALTRGLDSALVDGNYQLTIAPSKVRRAGTSVTLDGNNDGLQGGDYSYGTLATDDFFALYGDSDGDRDVDGQDYGRFGLTFLKSSGDPGFNPAMDSDGDGDVDGQDYGRFGQRFLKTLPF